MPENNYLDGEKCDPESDECPIIDAMSILGGKWKIIILFQLRDRVLRFGQLRKEIPGITQKMLTQQLRELESDLLIERKVYAEVPPRVEYKSTHLANELRPILDALCDWNEKRKSIK